MPNNIIEQDFSSLGVDVVTQQLIAPVMLGMVANQVFSIGDEFIVNSTLYKATKAIAIGDTISVGTGANDNCVVADTVTQQANDLIEKLNEDITIYNHLFARNSGTFTAVNITSNLTFITISGVLQFNPFSIAAGTYAATISRGSATYYVPLAKISIADFIAALPTWEDYVNTRSVNATVISNYALFYFATSKVTDLCTMYIVKTSATELTLVTSAITSTTQGGSKTIETVRFFPQVWILASREELPDPI